MPERLYNARAAFLGLLFAEVPAAAADLLEHVVPLCRTQLALNHNRAVAATASVIASDKNADPFGTELAAANEALRRAEAASLTGIQDWARSFGIETSWVTSLIHWSLMDHLTAPWGDEPFRDVEVFRRQLRGIFERRAVQDAVPKFTFVHAPWAPEAEEWATYKSHVERAVMQALTEYHDGAMARLRDYDLVPVRNVGRLPEHLRWLVWYQAAGQCYPRIADHISLCRRQHSGAAPDQHSGAAAALLAA